MPKAKDLTPTETVVLERLSDGRTTKEIAAERGTTEASVYNHITRIRAKGHQVPRSNGDGDKPSATADAPPKPERMAGANGKDDDLDLLNALSGPVAEDASALLDGLRRRLGEIIYGIEEIDENMKGLTVKRTDLDQRRETIQARIDQAAQVAEAVKPLVVS